MLKSGNQSKYAAPLAACLVFFMASATGAAERYVTVPGTWNSAAPELLVKAECHLDEPEFRLVGANRREVPAKVLERHGSLLRFAFNARPGERLRFIEGEKPTDPASGWQPASGVLRSIYRIKDGRANTREELEKLLDSGVPVGRTVEERVYSGWNPLAGNPRSLHLFEGVLHIARPGVYTFYTASTDASFLEIDGRPVVAWPGRHDVWGGLRGEHSGGPRPGPADPLSDPGRAHQSSGYQVPAGTDGHCQIPGPDRDLGHPRPEYCRHVLRPSLCGQRRGNRGLRQAPGGSHRGLYPACIRGGGQGFFR